MGISIPILDIKREYEDIKTEIDEAINRVLLSGRFILGPELNDLEKEIAQYCQTKYAIGVASGTEALQLTLIACGVGKGDEVITSPFTFVATSEVISHLSAHCVFVDINVRNFNIDTKLISSKITKRTKAIIPVHLFGQSCDMDPIVEIARDRGIKIIEDCAQAFGAEYKGRKVGSIGDGGCLSFYPTKNLGCYGDGGMVVTSDKDIYQKIKLLRNHGSVNGTSYEVLGYNSRLDEIQAAILRVKLGHLKAWNNKRREKAKLYNKYLANFSDIILPQEEDYNTHIYNQYAIRIKNRDMIKDRLQSKGISTAVYYPHPLHKQPIYKHLNYKGDELAVSEQVSKEILSLPIFPYLTTDEIKKVSESLISLISKN